MVLMVILAQHVRPVIKVQPPTKTSMMMTSALRPNQRSFVSVLPLKSRYKLKMIKMTMKNSDIPDSTIPVTHSQVQVDIDECIVDTTTNEAKHSKNCAVVFAAYGVSSPDRGGYGPKMVGSNGNSAVFRTILGNTQLRLCMNRHRLRLQSQRRLDSTLSQRMPTNTTFVHRTTLNLILIL